MNWRWFPFASRVHSQNENGEGLLQPPASTAELRTEAERAVLAAVYLGTSEELLTLLNAEPEEIFEDAMHVELARELMQLRLANRRIGFEALSRHVQARLALPAAAARSHVCTITLAAPPVDLEKAVEQLRRTHCCATATASFN